MSARPIPSTSKLTQPYWDAARRQELFLQHCGHCDCRVFPPRAHCPECWSDGLTWGPVSGRGTIYSFTIAHRAPHPIFAGQSPMVIAIVELEEGPRLTSNIVQCDPADLAVGMAVRVAFEPIDDSDVVLPVFVPA